MKRRQVLKNLALLTTVGTLAPNLLMGCTEVKSTKSDTLKTKNNAISDKLTDNSVGNSIKINDDNFKLLIKNGKVFTGEKLEEISLAITKDNKIKLFRENVTSSNEFDAKGKIVSPGFVDILADNAGNPKQTYKIFEKYKISDGATSVLQMHGGAAYVQEFFNHFGKLPHYVNYGVSTFVMVLRGKGHPATLKAIEKSLEEGALGVAHSIEYQPATQYSECLDYAKIAKKYDRPFFLHLRHSSEKEEILGVKEAIKLAKESGAHVHIDHIHSTGGTYNMPEALRLMQEAVDSGLKMTTCIYPYTFWATYIASARFNEGWQERYKITYKDLEVVGTGEHLTKARFAQLRTQQGVLVAVPEGTMPAEKTINLALEKDFCMIGSDGGIEREPIANSHPRGAGCFATAIRHAINIKMPLEKILHKITALPASVVAPAMNDRGVLKDGNIADITIFDLETINGKGTVANPNQFSSGIEAVFVNGELTYQNKKIITSKGLPLRNFGKGK